MWHALHYGVDTARKGWFPRLAHDHPVLTPQLDGPTHHLLERASCMRGLAPFHERCNQRGLLGEEFHVGREVRGGVDIVGVPRASLRVPVVHDRLDVPMVGHRGGGVLPVAHLKHWLQYLQVALEGHAPEPTEGAELVEGLSEVVGRVKLRLLEASILPFFHCLEGLEEGIVQLGENFRWAVVGLGVR